MRHLLVTIALAALATPALADEPLIQSHARSQPRLLPTAYPTTTTPAEEPATAAEAAEANASSDMALAQAGAAPAAAAAPDAEVDDDSPSVLFTGKVDHGAYGGLVLKTSNIAGETSLLVGGRVAWMIDHRLSLGLAGYGVASNVAVFDTMDDRKRFVEMAYGGLYASYDILPRSAVHLSLDGLIGAGGTTYTRRFDGWTDTDEEVAASGDAFFVSEVGANVVFNLVKFARVSVGPSWRFVQGVQYRKLRDGDFDGPGGSMTVDFGKF